MPYDSCIFAIYFKSETFFLQFEQHFLIIHFDLLFSQTK